MYGIMVYIRLMMTCEQCYLSNTVVETVIIKPWVDASIVELMYGRDYVKPQAVQHKDDNMYYEYDYKKLRNEVTSKINQARKLCFEKGLSENAGKPGKIW